MSRNWCDITYFSILVVKAVFPTTWEKPRYYYFFFFRSVFSLISLSWWCVTFGEVRSRSSDGCVTFVSGRLTRSLLPSSHSLVIITFVCRCYWVVASPCCESGGEVEGRRNLATQGDPKKKGKELWRWVRHSFSYSSRGEVYIIHSFIPTRLHHSFFHLFVSRISLLH